MKISGQAGSQGWPDPPVHSATAGQFGPSSRMMKVSVVSLCLLVCLAPCQGRNILSLLRGNPAPALSETREPKNVDIDRDEETGFLDTMKSAGYGLNILSLLIGNQAEERSTESPELLDYNHLYMTRVAKNVDIDTDEEDHPYETREAKNVESDEGEARGLLDTLNLSLAGNLDISNAVGQVSSDGLLSLLSNPGREIT